MKKRFPPESALFFLYAAMLLAPCFGSGRELLSGLISVVPLLLLAASLLVRRCGMLTVAALGLQLVLSFLGAVSGGWLAALVTALPFLLLTLMAVFCDLEKPNAFTDAAAPLPALILAAVYIRRLTADVLPARPGTGPVIYYIALTLLSVLAVLLLGLRLRRDARTPRPQAPERRHIPNAKELMELEERKRRGE